MSEKEPTIARPDNVAWLDESGEVILDATWKQVEDGPTVVTSARKLAGNMSPAYNQFGEMLSDDEKKERAKINVKNFLEVSGLHPENTFIMLPQQKWDALGVVNVDDVYSPGSDNGEPTVAADRADLIVTHNPDVVLMTRPADCPVLTIKGIDKNDNDVLAQLHVGWQGLNAGFLENGIEHLTEVEGVDKDSLRIEMSGAGYAESFHYKNAENPLDDDSFALNKDGEKAAKRFTHPERQRLFVNVEKTDSTNERGEDVYEFDMDMPGFIRSQLEGMGIDSFQLFEEGSDTTAPDSGYSSHRRDGGDKTMNTRDAVVSTLSAPDEVLIDRTYKRLRGAAALVSLE